jgi:hypothetical protein
MITKDPKPTRQGVIIKHFDVELSEAHNPYPVCIISIIELQLQ